MQSKSLELTGIGKRFGADEVLKGIDLAVRPGEFLSLVGMSGCGKSTLLRIIAGLESLDRGTVSIDGRNVTDLDPSDRDLSMVFQSYALYPHMTVRQNIATPLRMRRLSLPARLPAIGRTIAGGETLREIEAAVEDAARTLQISHLLDRKPGQLSGGQRQRVALARALVRSPAAFLMDEPLSNLDAKLRAHMRQELTDLHARLGATFIYVTHDQIEAMTMSDRIALMSEGRIEQLGTPDELYQRPATLTVARFIGTPSINLLPVEITRTGQVVAFGHDLDLTTEAKYKGPAMLGLRPEDLVPVVQGFPVRVVHSETYGADRFVTCELLDDTSVRVIMRQRTGETSSLQMGEKTSLGFPCHRAHVFAANGDRIEAGARMQVAV